MRTRQSFLHLSTRSLVPAACAAVLLVGPVAVASAQTPAAPGVVQAAAPDGTGSATQVGVSPESLGQRVDADDLRRRFDDVLRQYPPTLREVLRNDPSLLNDQQYLASYPALAAFVRSYPQVARNTRFYVGDANNFRPLDPRSQAIEMWQRVTETFSILMGFLLAATALGWLVRTALDHRRWLRSSKIQVDVHQKLFDRLASNDDLMTYIQTPAGQRFLEGSPVTPEVAPPNPRAVSAPINRILWSVQIGIVLVPLGLGFQWVARQVIDEVAQLLWFVGVLAVTAGIGFVGSAAVAYLISKRLGLIRDVSETHAPRSTAPLS